MNTNKDQNDNDSRRLREVIGRNQTRMTPSFLNASQPSEQENITTNSDIDEEDSKNNKGINNPPLGGIAAKTKSETEAIASIEFKKVLLMILKKYKFSIIIAVISLLILLTPLLIIITSSEMDRKLSKDLLKKFSSVTSDNDAAKIDQDQIDTEFPPIGDTDFESYFSQNVHSYLIDYLSNNGYCDDKTCTSSDAYVFFKRYLKVLTEFEKKSYKIDSGLLYETIAYDRSDEEMFSGSVKKQKPIGWVAIIKSLFSSKTDEISKLANKFWREIYIFGEDEEGNKIIVGTEWVFSLDKYVAYLMYGDSMHDTSELGTDKDLNIEAISSTKKPTGDVVSGNHTYKYSGCSASDSIYEGIIEEGYIYNRFKDTDLVNVLNDKKKLEEKIVLIIQNIFNQTVETYGNPNYCAGYSGGSSAYGTNICTYTVGNNSYSDLKVQLQTCELYMSNAKPVEGEELIDFEKYILGIVYAENGGAPTEALKVQAIAARSYVLNRGTYATLSDGTQILKIRSCTYDQVYCDPDKGCWSNVPGGQTKGTDQIYNRNATVHSGYDASKKWTKKPLSEDSKVRQAVNEVAGEVVVDSSDNIIQTGYVSTAQQAWNNSANSGKDYVSILLSHYSSAVDIKKGTCESVGAAVTGIPQKERMKYLFPNGVPTTAQQMQQYLTKITIPINNERGTKTTMQLTVHKALANNFLQAFTEIQKIGFKIKASSTSAYNWRVMATNSSKQSYHSYGSVVDVNWNDNPLVYSSTTTGNYKPGINPYSVTQEVVNIFKKNGFYWGGDWTSYKDYMHFSYTNN